MWRTIVLVPLFLSVGCAARPVTPVAISQPGDSAMDCAALDAAFVHANATAASYAKRDADLETKNVVGAIIIGAPGIDLTREEQIQARAWVDRARYLSQLKSRKGC